MLKKYKKLKKKLNKKSRENSINDILNYIYQLENENDILKNNLAHFIELNKELKNKLIEYIEWKKTFIEQNNKFENLKTVISILKAENNALKEKSIQTNKKDKRQQDIEDKAYSYEILKNYFGIGNDIKLVDFIIDLITENEVLNAELDLVPYQLEKQRELCAQTYEYWANIFNSNINPSVLADINKHISSAIKNTGEPTPEDLGKHIQDEEYKDDTFER